MAIPYRRRQWLADTFYYLCPCVLEGTEILRNSDSVLILVSAPSWTLQPTSHEPRFEQSGSLDPAGNRRVTVRFSGDYAHNRVLRNASETDHRLPQHGDIRRPDPDLTMRERGDPVGQAILRKSGHGAVSPPLSRLAIPQETAAPTRGRTHAAPFAVHHPTCCRPLDGTPLANPTSSGAFHDTTTPAPRLRFPPDPRSGERNPSPRPGAVGFHLGAARTTMQVSPEPPDDLTLKPRYGFTAVPTALRRASPHLRLPCPETRPGTDLFPPLC